MMRIPVSSPAVVGRLKDFCKPYDFVLAPIIREGDLQLDEEAGKPILVTRFNKNSEEWSAATYYNVRSGDPCSITTGESNSEIAGKHSSANSNRATWTTRSSSSAGSMRMGG